MSTDFRRTATCQALVDCLVRHLQKQRAALVEQISPGGGPITEAVRPVSEQLDQFDHALSELSLLDTTERRT